MAETQGQDIAWSMIGYCALALVAGIALGTFITGPALQKRKAKKRALAEKKTTAGK